MLVGGEGRGGGWGKKEYFHVVASCLLDDKAVKQEQENDDCILCPLMLACPPVW